MPLMKFHWGLQPVPDKVSNATEESIVLRGVPLRPPTHRISPSHPLSRLMISATYLMLNSSQLPTITTPDLPSGSEIYGKLPRVPTRGIPETYQSMGVITTDDGKVLPLYGRRTASRSDRFQYYTRTDTYNPVQLPIQHNRRDCTDDIGCEELYDRDVVTVKPTNQRGTATIYRFDGPTYVPGII
jgi:hypothetical protein